MIQAVGGVAAIRVDGKLIRVKGSFNIHLGAEKRTAITGSVTQGVLGYKVEAGIPALDGKVVIGGGTNPQELVNIKDATITVELVTGDVFNLYEAWYAGDGQVETENGELAVRFEGTKSKYITA